MNFESSCAINSENLAAGVLPGHSLLQTLEPKDKGTVASNLEKLSFHLVYRYMLVKFHLVKLQGTGFGLFMLQTTFYVADKAKI